jgi:hypothetical protein
MIRLIAAIVIGIAIAAGGAYAAQGLLKPTPAVNTSYQYVGA